MNPQGVMFYPTDHVDDIRPPKPPESTEPDWVGAIPGPDVEHGRNPASPIRARREQHLRLHSVRATRTTSFGYGGSGLRLALWG